MHKQYSQVTINGQSVELAKPLTSAQFNVLSCLNLHYGEIVGTQYIAEKCAPSHGAYLYDWNARIHIVQVNKALKGTGFAVYNHRAKGYQLTNC